MSKPYTLDDLSSQLDSDLNWRRRELSDLKSSIRAADHTARNVLRRSLVAMCYAHWEGYVKLAANKYFEHITIRKKFFHELDLQFYRNTFLGRLDAYVKNRQGISANCAFIDSILESKSKRFSFINPQLIDTKSNLNTDVTNDLCIICGFDNSFFEEKRSFIDVILLKKRNAIAHGQDDAIGDTEIDDLVDQTISLMEHFRTLVENKTYSMSYLSGPVIE